MTRFFAVPAWYWERFFLAIPAFSVLGKKVSGNEPRQGGNEKGDGQAAPGLQAGVSWPKNDEDAGARRVTHYIHAKVTNGARILCGRGPVPACRTNLPCRGGPPSRRGRAGGAGRQFLGAAKRNAKAR